VNADPEGDIEINQFHLMLGHCGLDRWKRIANIHGFRLIGEFKAFKECSISKAGQKNVKKEWKGGSQISAERLYTDITSIKIESYVRSKFRVLIVDNYTDYCWSLLLKY
jgi:DNA repair protein RadC